MRINWKNVLIRLFALLTFFSSLAYLFISLIILYEGGISTLILFGIAILLCASSVYNILFPKKVYHLITLSLLFIVVYGSVRFVNSREAKILCEKILEDVNCAESDSGFRCSEQANVPSGFYSPTDCSRNADQKRKVADHVHKIEIEAEKKIELEAKSKRQQPDYIKSKLGREEDLTLWKNEEINKASFFEILLDTRPSLLQKLPSEIVLTDDVIKVLVENLYKFDFFLPEAQRNQVNVVKVSTPELNTQYESLKYKYIEAASLKIRSRDEVLMHPDFFMETSFVRAFLENCSNYRTPEGSLYPESRTYFANQGLFLAEHKQAFKEAIMYRVEISCLPMDLIMDENFIIPLAEKHVATHLIDEVVKINKSPNVLKAFVNKRVVESEFNLVKTEILKPMIEPEVLNDKYFQETLFSRLPFVIRNLDFIDFQNEVLIAFIKNTYKPERFFNDKQIAHQPIAKLLKTHSNSDQKSYKNELLKLQDIVKYGHLKRYVITEYRRAFRMMNDQMLNDDDFHLSNLNIANSSDGYIIELHNFRAITPKLKKFMLETCKENGKFSSLIFNEAYTPDFVNLDPDFKRKLSENCNAYMKAKSHNPSMRIVMEEKHSKDTKAMIDAAYRNSSDNLNKNRAKMEEIRARFRKNK